MLLAREMHTPSIDVHKMLANVIIIIVSLARELCGPTTPAS